MENPAFFSTARTSADRPPDLQCRTIFLSWGSRSSAEPFRNSPLGMSTAPGMLQISYSLGSRTSMSMMSSPRSSIALSSWAVIVASAAARCASSESAPQNVS